MKKFYILLAILFIGKFSFSQVIFQEDFESGVIPTSFTMINDNNTPNSQIASLFPTAWANLVDVEDTSNNVASSPSWFTPAATADRWLITPSIAVTQNNILSWKAVARDGSWRDGYSVKLSTTGKTKADFTVNLFSITKEDSIWKSRNVSLSAYSGQNVYIAFVNNSNDMFILDVDNIKVAQPSSVNDITADNNSISVYPNPAKDFITVNSIATIKSVKVYNTVGQVVIEKLVKDNVAKIAISELKSGVYFVATETEKGIVTKKINVL